MSLLDPLHGDAYQFWSGIGSDFGEATLFAGAAMFLRHRNCHVKGCWRPGHDVRGTPYRACHRHHPGAVHGGRDITRGDILEAHRRAGGN